MEKNIEKVFVTFYKNTKDWLNQRKLDILKGLKRNEDFKVVNLEYVLNCGDISNVPYSNAEIYEDLYFSTPDDIFKEMQSNLNTVLSYNKKATIEFFINTKRSNEFCNFYYFINKFKNIKNIFLNYYHEETIEVYHEGTGKVLDLKIVIDKKEPLTNDMVSKFTEKWQELVFNNKAVRECCNGTLIELSLQEAKEKILPVFRKTFRNFPRLYVDFLEKCNADKNFAFDYIIFEYISKKLVESGVVERTYNTNVQSGCGDIYFEQKFRLVQNNKE